MGCMLVFTPVACDVLSTLSSMGMVWPVFQCQTLLYEYYTRQKVSYVLMKGTLYVEYLYSKGPFTCVVDNSKFQTNEVSTCQIYVHVLVSISFI